MKMYKIDVFDDEKIIGTYPQIQVPDPLVNWVGIEKIQAGNLVDTPRIKLHNKAKLTDFVSVVMVGGQGLVVSEKVKDIISSFEPNIQIRPIDIIKRKQIHHYYFIFSERTDKYFDFINSSIVDIDFTNLLQIIKGVKNKEDLAKEKVKSKGTIHINHVILKSDHPDIFISDTFVLIKKKKNNFESSNIFVSQKLKEALEKAGCTGMSFSKIPDEPVIPI